MRAEEFIFKLDESLSRTVFHYTQVPVAAKILNSGQFQLTSSLGSSAEEKFAIKGYPYYMSTTRTRHGGYHGSQNLSDGVLFVLDGDYYNQRYPSKPVDYFLNRNPGSSNRSHEAEDRLFSKKPSIPIDGVTAIHIYIGKDAEKTTTVSARQAMISAKTRGIAAYLYNDIDAWKNFDTRKTVSVSQLTGKEAPSFPMSKPSKENRTTWLELIGANRIEQLSKEADRLRLKLLSNNNDTKYTALENLIDYFAAGTKPSNWNRGAATKLIQFMQQHKLQTPEDLFNYLVNKWIKIPPVIKPAKPPAMPPPINQQRPPAMPSAMPPQRT